MELTVRDWMVIIGVVLIAGLLLDALRRIRAERRSRVRMKLSRAEGRDTAPVEHPTVLRELPNGGARVKKRSELAEAARRQAVEAVGGDQPPPAAPASPRAPAASAAGPASPAAGQPPVRPAATAPSADAAKPASTVAARATPPEDDLVSGLRGERSDGGNLDWLDDIPASQAQAREEEGKLPRAADPEVFMLHVVANDPAGFNGDDIMQILLACDLRFGDMNFFHRHEQEAGRGPIQFSVANMMQPGVFDIDHMAELKTPGLLFFVTLPGPEDMMKAYDYMLETAQAVARNLGGSVLDETRSAITRQTLEHNRQQIRDLERRMLAHNP